MDTFISTTATNVAPRSEVRSEVDRGTRAGLTEGAILLVALYTLVGLGIGTVCGSLLLGTSFGLLIGVFAAGAILLIRGAAQGATSA